MAKTSHASDRFIMRLPDGMRDRIKAAAERRGHTMNAGVVDALQKAYPEEIFQQDLHINTITALQNCDNPATLQQMLKEANAMAARNGFPFSYDIEINNRSEKEKTILITIKTM